MNKNLFLRTFGFFAVVVVILSRISAAAQFTHPTLGYSFSYPDQWFCKTTSVEKSGASGPVLSTVRDIVQNIPEGAAIVFVQTFPPFDINFREGTDEYSKLREMALAESHDPNIRNVRHVDGTGGVRFTETWEAGTFTKLWLARRREGRLFVFMLEYYANDPKGASYERDLDAIVSSIAVSPTPHR